ncbi:MAG: SLBB domain-containing protein [Thiohalocapsa sp.]|nr:SLBB domain-containing protein [Thiohalocapsa sp.]MCF7990322.1 SLBB domain-containing protein [Thiohalocapsa sp.]
MKRNGLSFFLAITLIAFSIATFAADPYRLGSNDVVRITVFGQPDLTTVARVNEGGSISFPFIGEVSVAGLTTRDAELKVARLLEQKDVVKSAQVGVMVESYQSRRVAVLGQVTNPGNYVITRGTTVMDLISEAGGLTENAGSQAILTRADSGGGKTVIDLDRLLGGRGDTASPMVSDGDTVFVERADRFYIYGQVNRPGTYSLERNMTIVQALSVAGGLTDKGTERGMKVKRTSDEGKVKTIPVGLTDRIAPNDVIFVKESLF